MPALAKCQLETKRADQIASHRLAWARTTLKTRNETAVETTSTSSAAGMMRRTRRL
ncbi:hypothetical protein BC477_01055 [Clavibacter michiganensis subsp. michiganensis]|uniref:Uncharacterized protein n=1 Tax=Clavibacter michiganensis subsp. michiganensis TaxID=33013 RepID=A0A251XFB8_CLAMM|nr:hypothetical protein BC477_01055 [Clavibacter michiganensis subsp. michiganensis]OUE00835.1 hypothetical protein CMMCAS07_15465 [Clavibacter michiganensis subsp. michiganensis]